MPHIQLAGGTATRRPEVHEDWLGPTASANDYTGKHSKIRGFKVRLGPGLAPESQTAQWDPRTREIEIDANVMLPGVKSHGVDFNDAIFRERHPLVVGALIHETAHAAHSTWTPFSLDQSIKTLREHGFLDETEGKFTRPMIDVLVALEEHTCEWKLWKSTTGVRKYLPAIVFDLLAREFKIGDSPYGAGIVTALILARHDAGTLGKGDVSSFREAVETVLTREQIDTLLGLAAEYREHEQTSDDGHPFQDRRDAILTMHSIATRWLEALGIDPEADEGEGGVILALPIPTSAGDPGDADGSSEGEDTEDGEGAAPGDGSGDGDEAVKAPSGETEAAEDREVEKPHEDGPFVVMVKDAAAEAKGVEWIKASERLGDAKVRRELEERAAEAERKRTTEGEREKAYRAVHGYTETRISDHSTRLAWLDPTPAERAAATALGRELQRVVATEPIITETKMNRPGKRVLGRGMVARRAEAAQGRIPTSDYWKGRHRAMPDTPPVTVGILMDVSGSMSAAAHPLASASYILANGVAQIDGRFAAVAFGNSATGIVRPGQHITRKPFISPADGTEAFKAGFLALDGALDLVAGEGVRVLVILSDGVFVNGRDAAYANLTLGSVLPKAGVVALHLDVDGSCVRYGRSDYDVRHGNPRPIVDVAGKSPLDVARIIGRTVREEVARVAAGR